MSESNDRRIDEATPDTDVTGVEKVPVSDGGTAKCLTIEQIKDFVATKFAALQNASVVSVNTDGVYLKKDGELKPIAANVFADAIIAFMFGKESETELADTDEIIISRDGDVKKTTISDIAAIVKEIVEIPNIDIGTLDSIDDDDEIWSNSQFAVKNGTSDSDPTKKCTADDIGRYLLVEGLLAFAGYADSESFGEYDRIAVVHHGGGSTPVAKGLRLMRKDQLPFGDGDVKGPSANTENKIPQWDGANSKKLKDGLNLATNITSQSGETEVPTALAVHNAVKDKTNAPSTNTANRIPQWNGANSKTLKDGLDFVPGEGSGADNSKVPSVKAVSDAIASAITAALQTGQTTGAIAQAIADAISTSLSSGSIKTALDEKVTGTKTDSISSTSTTSQIPSALSVWNLFSANQGVAFLQYMPTTGYETGKLVFVTQAGENYGMWINSGNSQTPNWNRVAAVSLARSYSGTPSQGGSGYQPMEIVYSTTQNKLYLNVGTFSSASWVTFSPDAA